MWRLTVQDNICYALDEGELFTLSFEKGAKHTFVVCKNVFQIREDFTDEGLDSSRMNWRGTDDGVNENLLREYHFAQLVMNCESYMNEFTSFTSSRSAT